MSCVENKRCAQRTVLCHSGGAPMGGRSKAGPPRRQHARNEGRGGRSANDGWCTGRGDKAPQRLVHVVAECVVTNDRVVSTRLYSWAKTLCHLTYALPSILSKIHPYFPSVRRGCTKILFVRAEHCVCPERTWQEDGCTNVAPKPSIRTGDVNSVR